ncbi:hypothetical protein QR680_014709 [Steinernema hermaphroditum]|uniref:Uncharacterized protein n=1 Tax=Steinernema hermaphroditum TaxID=289476 RepID=A0AA39M4E1_9BILA|nr:hypothetical protein QR680_014709 [Steinernema hermaphroditum]
MWVLVITGVYPQVDKYSPFIVFVSLLPISLQVFYDLTTLRLFWERVLILLFPLRPLRLLKQVFVVGSFAVGCIIVLFVFVTHFYLTGKSEHFLPKECYAFICSNVVNRLFGPLFRTALSAVVLVMGSCFVVLLARSKSFQNRNNRMFNKLTQYIFLVRLVSDMTPFIVEMALTVTTTKSLGYYVGPIGAIGCVLEGFFSSAAYYYVYSRKSDVVQQHNTTTIEDNHS